ncbi:hypothetical protein FXO38_17169 [Capsicum annuum]|nr:hypothetical protein FXO38_17169 [Capsicum annuum]
MVFLGQKKGQVNQPNPKGKEQTTTSHPIKVKLFNAASVKFLETRDFYYRGAESSGASVDAASSKGKFAITYDSNPPTDVSPNRTLRKRSTLERPKNKTLNLASTHITRPTILEPKSSRTALELIQAKANNNHAKSNGFTFPKDPISISNLIVRSVNPLVTLT